MPSLVCDFIKKHINILSENALEVMIRDIGNELQSGIEQANEWQSLKLELEGQLKVLTEGKG